MPRPPSPGRLISRRPSSALTASRCLFLAISHSRGKPCPLFITTSDALPASGSRPIHAAARATSAQRQRRRPQRHPRPARGRIHPFCVLCGARLSRCLPASRRQPEVLRDGDIRPCPRRRPQPAACWPATESRSPASAPTWPPLAASARPWPPDWTRLTTRSCPGRTQAWERAQVYLGLCERYQELYQAQVADLHLLMATVPGCSLPLSHRHPLTDPLTDTHTGHVSLIRARRGAATRTTPPVVQVRRVSARLSKERFTMSAGWRAESALHAAARPAYLYIAVRAENARTCR